MKIEIKKVIWPSLFSSLFLLLLGLLLFFKSGITLMAISYIIGAILISIGVIAIVKFITNPIKDVFNQLNIIYGVLSIIAGIFLISTPETIGSIIPIVVGITIIISSSLKVQQALILKNTDSKYWLASLITSILCLICGILLLFNPFTSAVIVTKIIGLFILIYAILDIVNIIILKKGNSLNIEIEEKSNVRRSKKVKEAKIIKEQAKEEEN